MEAAVVLPNSLRSSFFSEEIAYSNIDAINQKYAKIYMGDILCFFSKNELNQVLSKIKNLLLPNGYIVIEQFDLYELILSTLNENLPTDDFNNVIAPRSQLFFNYEIINLLVVNNFKILSADVDNYRLLVEAECLK